MRQTFNVTGGPFIGRNNLPALRAAMRTAGLDCLHIPHDDAYLNEIPPPQNDRLAWASGFTGSAGTALILADEAHVFVDGRYVLQAQTQLDDTLFCVHGPGDQAPADWLAAKKRDGMRIGYDPHLVSLKTRDDLAGAATAIGAQLIEVPSLIDTIWTNRPDPVLGPVRPHRLVHAGKTNADKRADLIAHLTANDLDAVVITSPVSIAWLFNIRADHLPNCPAPLGRAVVHKNGDSVLFLESECASESDLIEHLGPDTRVQALDSLAPHLAGLRGKKVSLDPGLASFWFFETLADANIVCEPDPCALPRACKNPVEIDGARRAHRLDGAALCRFLCWLEANAPSGTITEIDAVKQLEAFREESDFLRDIAFPTIAGSGPNGAIIHYGVNEATNRRLEQNTLFLLDSGGQYDFGTTDVTRTIAIGPAGASEKRLYTLVLQAHLRLAMARFPEGVSGVSLDILARSGMWAEGLDYDHGTGHGVGSYLNVHEGPQIIARAQKGKPVPLRAGMIVSNEPGYYRTGAFGIRIENLQSVTKASAIDGGEHSMMGFEVLTLAPYDRNLIEITMLGASETAFINSYHERVRTSLTELLDPLSGRWLEKACAPLS